MTENKANIKVYIPGREFVLPYIAREMPEFNVELAADSTDCDVVILNPGQQVPDSNSDVAVLFCPNIVGTGMNGLPMEIAGRIARGSYYHLGGNEARLSTIHASDVAKAVRLSYKKGGQYIVTDGEDPTFHDFAEALAWRINHKRILTLNSKWVNWIVSPSLRRIITKDNTFDSSRFFNDFDFHPVPVTEYLRTHVYDEESL